MTEHLGDAVLDLTANLDPLVRKLAEAEALTKREMDQMGRDVDGLNTRVATMGTTLDRSFLTPLATGLTKADTALGTFDRAVARARAETGDFSRALTDVGVTSTLVSRQIGSSWDTLRQDVGRTTTSVDVDTRRLDSRLQSVGSNSLLMAQEVAAAWDRMTGSTTRSAVAVTGDAGRESAAIRDLGTGALMSAQQFSSGFEQMTAAERDLRGETDRSTTVVIGDLQAQKASVEALRDAYLELAVAAHVPRGGVGRPVAGLGVTTEQIVTSSLSRAPGGYDPLLARATQLVAEMGTEVSQSRLEREMGVKYLDAMRMLNELERRGVVSGYPSGGGPRRALISPAEAAGLWGVRGATKSGSRENPIGTVTLAGQQFLGGLAASNAASALRQDAGTTTGTHDPQMVSLIDTLRHMDATPSDLSPKSVSDLRDAIVAAEAMRKPTSGTAATTRGLGGLDTDLLSSINDSLNNIEREVGILDVKAGMPSGGGGRRGGGAAAPPPRGESTVAIDSAQYAGLLAALRDAAGGGGGGDGGGPPVAVGGGGDGGGGGMGPFLSTLLWGGGARRRRGRFTRFLMPGIGAGALSLGAMAGLGPEHIAMTGLGIAGSAATALGGAGMLALGGLGQMAVGGGSDLAVMKSTLGDTQQLFQAYNKLSTAVAVYGASSRQAAVAQSQLNDTINTLGGPNAPGVKAEMQLAKNMKALDVLWDKQTQQARVQAANIMEQVVGLGTKFVPLIARAAQQNLAIINTGLKPLFGWLEGPQGVGIFTNLENNFRRSLPTAVHAFDMSVEGLLKLMSQASNHTGGFVTSLDHLATRFNNWAGSPRAEATITRLIDDFRTWGKFVRALGDDIYLLFKNDAGTGHDIIVTLTGMLQKLGDWEKSTQGRQQLHNIFEVHKEEVLALLKLLPLLLAPLGRLYLTIAPALTEVVTALAKAVGFLVQGLSAVGPAAQYLLALGIVGGKLFGFKTMLTAIGGALGIIKKEAPAAAEGLLAVDAAAAGGGARGGRTAASTGGSFLSLGGGTSTATVAREEAAAETSLRGRISGFAGRMGTMIKGGLTNGLNLFMRGGAIALLGSTLVGVVSQGFHGGTKDAINKIGGDAAIGAGIGSVFGPEGAAGGAIIGGLIGTLTSFTNHHAQDEGKRWAQEFSKGTAGFLPDQLHDQLQTNLSHHLGRAFQAQQDAANLRTSAQAGRTGPGGQPPGATTADFNRWYNEMFLAGKTAADQFNRAFSSVKYKSTPSFIMGATQALRSLPPEARKEAAKSIIDYAAGLERNKQLPKNSMRAILGAIEQQFPSLRGYLHAQGLATARDVAATYKFTQARNNVIGWISGIRKQFGLFNVDNDVTGKNWARNYKTTIEDLIRFSHDKDPHISGPAKEALKELCRQGKSYIGALKKTIETDIPAMAVQIRDGIPGAVPNAIHAFGQFATNLQTLVDAGLITTQQKASILNGEMDKLLGKFKDPVKKMTLSVELTMGTVANTLTTGVRNILGLPTHATGGFVVPGDPKRDGTLAMLSGDEFVVTKDGQRIMEQHSPGLLHHLKHKQAPHFPGGRNNAHQSVRGTSTHTMMRQVPHYAEGGPINQTHKYNMAAMVHTPMPGLGGAEAEGKQSMNNLARVMQEGTPKIANAAKKATQEVTDHYKKDLGKEVPDVAKKSVNTVERDLKSSKIVDITTKQMVDVKTQWTQMGRNTTQTNKDLQNWLSQNWTQERNTLNKTWTQMGTDVKGSVTQQHTDVKNITTQLQRDASANFNTLLNNTKGSFDAMSKHVDQRSNDMKTSVTKKTSDAASSGKTNIDNLEKSIYGAMDASVSVTGTGVDRIGSDLDKALHALGVSKISIPAMSHSAGANPLHRAGGGLVQVGGRGEVGRDSVPLGVNSAHGYANIVVAPGEKLAVINRHQEPIIDRALSREGYAGLPGLFNDIKTPHYMASGGFIKAHKSSMASKSSMVSNDTGRSYAAAWNALSPEMQSTLRSEMSMGMAYAQSNSTLQAPINPSGLSSTLGQTYWVPNWSSIADVTGYTRPQIGSGLYNGAAGEPDLPGFTGIGYVPHFAGGGFWVRTGATLDPTMGQPSAGSGPHAGFSFAELLEAGSNAGMRPDLTQLLGEPRVGFGMPEGTAIDIRMPGSKKSYQIWKNDVGSGQAGNPHYTIDLHQAIANALGWHGNQDVEVAKAGTDPNAIVKAGGGTAGATIITINAPKVTGKGPISDMVRKALSDVADGANKYEAAHAPVGPAGGVGWTGYIGSGGPIAHQAYLGVLPVSRTDMGVDFTGAGIVRAVGDGTVLTTSAWPGWPGTGQGVVYSTAKGNVYDVEHVQPLVHVGQRVKGGDPIVRVLPGYPWLETGWANASASGPATPYNGAPDGTPMPAGKAFRTYIGFGKGGILNIGQFSREAQAAYHQTGDPTAFKWHDRGGMVAIPSDATATKPPRPDVIAAFNNQVMKYWGELGGRGDLPPGARSPHFEIDRQGMGGDPTRAYTEGPVGGKTMHFPWSFVNMAQTAGSPSNYNWARQSIIHEMAHTMQSAKTYQLGRPYVEGGAQAWAKERAPQILHNYQNPTAYSKYSDYVETVYKDEGWDWINRGQFLARHEQGGMVDIPSDAMSFVSGGLPSRYGNTRGTRPYVRRRPSSRQRGHHTTHRSGSGTGVYSGGRTPKPPKPPKITDLKLNAYLQKFYPQAYQNIDILDKYNNEASSLSSWEGYLENLYGGSYSTAYDDAIVQVTDAQGNTSEVENQHGMPDPQPPHHFIPGEEQWAGWPVGTGGYIGALPRGDNDGKLLDGQRPMTFLGVYTKELDDENAISSTSLTLQTQMESIKAQTSAQKDLDNERAAWLANAVDPNYPFQKLLDEGKNLGTYTYTKNFQFRPPWPGATMRKWQQVFVEPWYKQYWDEIHQYRNMQARVDWIEKKKERLGIGKTRATTHITDHFRGLRRDVQLRAAGATFNARNLLSGQLGKLTSQERRDLGYTRASHIPPASWLGDTSTWRRQGVLDEAEIQSIFETQRQKLISIENKSEFQGAIDRIKAMAALGTAETDAKAALSEKYTGIRADMNDAIKADKGVASEDKRQVNLAKKQATTDASAYNSLWTAIGNPDDGSGILGGIAKYTNPMGDFEIGRLELGKTISDIYQVVKDLGGVGATVSDANKAAAGGGAGTGSEVAQQIADLQAQQIQQLGEALAVSQAQYAQLANIGDLHFGFGGFFDAGGIIPGPLGSPQVVVAHGGETVLPTHKQQPVFQVIVQDGAVDSSKIRIIANGEVQRVTRGYAGAAGRGLPSAGGGV